jgi:protoporphyrinogen oxidase
VRSISPASDGELRIDLDSTGPEDFSRVVVTTAAPLTARVCPGLSAVEKTQLTGIKYQGIVCASVLMKNQLSPFYVTNITDSGMPFTAVIDMSALVDPSEFGGSSLVYVPRYVGSDSSYFNVTDEQVQAQFVPALERMFPRFKRSDVLCFQVSRVKYLLPIPTINYSANLPSITTSVPGLYVVNSAQIVNGTLNINETIGLAESAAAALAQSGYLHNPAPKRFAYELAEAYR